MIDAYRIREMLFEYGRKQREAENKVRIVNDNRSRNALRKYTDIVESAGSHSNISTKSEFVRFVRIISDIV